MSDFRLSFPACVIAGKNRLLAEDILILRMFALPEGVRSDRDAATLIALHNSCPEKCPQWDAFFIESVTQYIVHDCYPYGAIGEDNAVWFERLFVSDGVINSATELELLLHILEVASDAPERLSVLALEQLRLALCENAGAYRHVRPQPVGGIALFDLDYVYRILRGAVSRGRIVLSPTEKHILLEIDHGTARSTRHPGWRDLIEMVCDHDRPDRGKGSTRWLRIADDALLERGLAA